MNAYSKLIVVLVVAIAATALILIYQVSVTKKISVERSARPLIEETAMDIPIDPIDPVYGNQGAPITITEFIDLNSAQSQSAHKTITAFIDENPQKMRLIFKDFPASGFFASSDNYRPHLAAYCALKQDRTKFFKYIDELFAQTGNVKNDKVLGDTAVKIGLNQNTLKACMDSAEAKTRIESSISLAKSIGLKTAPEIYVNSKKVNYLNEINLTDLLKEVIKEY